MPHDPTRTTTLRKRYAQRLRGILGKLMAEIRKGFVSQDVLQIQNAPSEPESQEPYDFPTTRSKVARFMQWLRRQLQRGYLSLTDPEKNVFIKSAYEQGVDHARQRLSVSTPEPDFDLPPHRSSLQELYTRSYRLLQGVTNDMSRQIRDELVEGLRDGDHSSQISRSISDRVQKVGKHRSTLIARTEVINAYSEGSLNQFEEADVEGVAIQAEIVTAEDERVCEICKAVADMGVFPLSDVRNSSVEAAGRTVNVKPPIHPRCRCALVPIT